LRGKVRKGGGREREEEEMDGGRKGEQKGKRKRETA
jgi:hypothetical protein